MVIRRKFLASVAVLSLAGVGLVTTAMPSSGAASATIVGTARGQAIEVRADVPPADVSAGDSLVDVSRADSRINSAGLYPSPTAPDDPTQDTGGIDAIGEGVPLRATTTAPSEGLPDPAADGASATVNEVAVASTAGPGDVDDDGTVPGSPTVEVPPGCLAAPPCLATSGTLVSHSEADQGVDTPQSSNWATSEDAAAGAGPAATSAAQNMGSSSTQRFGTDAVTSHAEAHLTDVVIVVTDDPGTPFIEVALHIDYIDATATADQNLGGGTASAGCDLGAATLVTTTVLGTTEVPLPLPECEPGNSIDVAPFPVTVELAEPVTPLVDGSSETVGDRSRASIAAVTITAAGQVARLGIAEASAQAVPVVDRTCGLLTDPAPSARGMGTALVLDPGPVPAEDPLPSIDPDGELLRVDIAAADAIADENGVPGTALLHQRDVLAADATQDRLGDARGIGARIQNFPEPPADRSVDPEAPGIPDVPPPVVPPEPAPTSPPESGNPTTDTQVASSAVGSGPDATEHAVLASADAPGPVTVKLTEVSSSAQTTSTPAAAASAAVDIENIGLGSTQAPAPVTVDLAVVTSTAHADASVARGSGGVAMVGRAPSASGPGTPGLSIGGNISGVPVNLTASAITSSTEAEADGVTSSSDLTWTIVDLRGTVGPETIGPITMSGGAGDDGPDSVEATVGDVTITVDFVAKSLSDPDDAHAYANVDVVRITSSRGDLVAVGRSRARAFDPGAMVAAMAKDVDIHYTPTGGPSYGDDGENVVPHQKLWYRLCVRNSVHSEGNLTGTISDLLDPRLKGKQAPAPFTLAGQLLEGAIDLAPGDEAAFEFLVEVRPDTPLGGPPIANSATFAGTIPLVSNSVAVVVAVDPDQPALSAGKRRQDRIDPNRTLVSAYIANAAGAGVAHDPAIERIDCNEFVLAENIVQPTKSTIQPGKRVAFTFEVVRTDPSVTRFVCDVRETATGETLAMTFAFD